ncbi:MAG: hypothetical protein F4220_06360 [Gammaproteobacteria bacterium]|nr:hypothetical protein [Gammaproteobacteria bacterium]
MKLRFSLLLIDDDPDSIAQALMTLRDYLEENGFELATEAPPIVSVDEVRTLSRDHGKEFDLVAVDYQLGSKHFHGGDMASTIRTELEYTDMVFYSDRSVNLHEQLASAQVEGVFVASREELDEALVGLADTVIGKAVDLNHMRGIAMAEIAEMDLIMEDTLAATFQSAGEALNKAAQRTATRVKKSMEESSQSVDKVVSERGIAGLIRDARLFSSVHKYWALKRVCKTMSTRPDMAALDSYESEVIHKRNMLAHAKEVDDEGTITLQSSLPGSTVTINDQWMAEFRRTLREQRSALETVCAEVRNYFS